MRLNGNGGTAMFGVSSGPYRSKNTERRGYARAGDELTRLTARQRDVAALVADGRTNAEIAARLALTEGTVVNHMEQAMRRLELRSRGQLAVWAYRHGLNRPDEDADEPLRPAHG